LSRSASSSLDGEARLTDTPGTGQGEKPRAFEQSCKPVEVTLATNETRDPGREIVHRFRPRDQKRRFVGSLFLLEEDPFLQQAQLDRGFQADFVGQPQLE
jgi:hypothetical protein